MTDSIAFHSSPKSSKKRSGLATSSSRNKVQLSQIQQSRLVGRDGELELLQSNLRNVLTKKNQAGAMVFVHGESGCGKTSLVKACFHQNTSRILLEDDGAFFIEGGFDRHASRPYSAIVDAATQLCNLIAESKQLDEIRAALEKKQTLLNVSVLAKLVPAMKAIAGEAATENHPDRTVGNHSFRLFMDNFKTFFKTVCEIFPVIMFLDDIQWAKEDDRELFLSIASDSSKNFLFVAAAQSDKDLKELRTVMDGDVLGSERIQEIPVGPLGVSHVNELVAGMLGMQTEQTTDLSELVWRKTGGNAYFVTKYVEDLHQQNLVTYSFGSFHWEWDLKQIDAQTDVSDNVVSLLSRKLKRMTSDVQQVLMHASCLGQVVDKNALQRIFLEEDKIFKAGEQKDLPSNKPKVEQGKPEISLANPDKMEEAIRFQEAFKQAIDEGLLEKSLAEGCFRFSHSRVQQAAYELLPHGEEGDLLQIRSGETLLRMSEWGEEWMFFSGVDLLSKFSSYLPTPESRIRVARLCLEAGKRAELKSAFVPATEYLKTGIKLLDQDNRWTEHYSLCLELHAKAAELGRTHGDGNATLSLIDETLRHVKCLDDKVSVFETKAFVLAGLDRLPEALQTCKEVLTDLNMSLPENPSKAVILAEFAKTKRLLKGRKALDLVSTLSPMTDKVQEQAMEFLHATVIFSWIADIEKVTTFTCLKMMRKTLKYGISKYSPYAVATFGMILGALGELDGAYVFGLAAVDMLKKFEETRVCHAAVYATVESLLRHLKRPLYESLAPLLESHVVGMQTGEIEYAALSLSGHGTMCILIGAQLGDMVETLTNYVQFFREYSQGMAEGLSLPWFQFTMNLRGEAADPLVLTGAAMNEEEFLQHHREGIVASQTRGNDSVFVKSMNMVKMILLYLFDELEAADKCRTIWETGSPVSTTHFVAYFSVLFSGLTSLGLARKYPRKRRLYKRRAKKHITRLESMVSMGGVNALLILKFLCAEKLTLKEGPEKTQEARSAFEDTITLAARTGSRLVRALACERLGYFLLERHELTSAGDYLKHAFTQYAEYGAMAKVEQIRKNFDFLDFAGPLAEIDIARRGGASAQLQPKMAATERHKKLEFESSEVSGISGVSSQFLMTGESESYSGNGRASATISS